MIPLRWIFRSRWAALVWAGGICLSAARFVGGDAAVTINAANSADTAAAAASALRAEDPE